MGTTFVESEQTKRTRELIRSTNGALNPDAKETMERVLDAAEAVIQPGVPPDEHMRLVAQAIHAQSNAQVRNALAIPGMIRNTVDEHILKCPLRAQPARPTGSVGSWSVKDGWMWAWNNKLAHALVVAVLLAVANWLESPSPKAAVAAADAARKTALELSQKVDIVEKTLMREMAANESNRKRDADAHQ